MTMAFTQVLEPTFAATEIESKREDGYWAEAAKLHRNDHAPGIISSGLVSGVVAFLDNPAATGKRFEQGWTKHEIATFDSPVAITTADITGDGWLDIIVCHDYGPQMLECNMEGGKITWLKNPGRKNLEKGHWEQSYIGRWPAMHRLKTGYFTQRSFLELIAAPVVRGAHDKATPLPILKFQRPSLLDKATEWHAEVIDDQNFTVVHELTSKKFDGPDGLESLLVSSREGLARLYYQDGKWKREVIGSGVLQELHQSPTSETPGSGDYWGTGTADAGKFGGDPFAYIATADPFHGTTLCVYTKVYDGLKRYTWKRNVIDTFGTPAQRLKYGEGPAHFIVCADFDGDGNDEFLVSLFGPVQYDDKGNLIPPDSKANPQKGIFYYKPIDLEYNIFAKWKVSDTSSGRIAVGDFTKSGRLDFVSISYNVPNYYEEPDPKVRLFTNTFAPAPAPALRSSIFPSLWAGEGLIRVRNPRLYSDGRAVSQTLPLVEVANVEVSVQVLGRGEATSIACGTGVKVLHGALKLLDAHGDVGEVRAPLSLRWPAVQSTCTTLETARAHCSDGAVLLRMRPLEQLFDRGGDDGGSDDDDDDDSDDGWLDHWPTGPSVPIRTALDLASLGLRAPDLRFVRVDSLPWGDPFEGADFWNMPGFHFRFYEDDAPIAHVQFWAAGKNVDCGLHNHRYDLFGETHVCFANGSAHGGMWCVNEKHAEDSLEEVEKLPASAFQHSAMKPLEEHGGMWMRDGSGRGLKRPDGTLRYPWHTWRAGDGAEMDVWMAVEFDATVA